MKRRAFILPVALAMAAIIAATVIFCAGLLGKGLAEPQRQMAAARAQALWGLDVALAQLQAEASSDTTATANAALTGNSVNPAWTGAWAQGSSTPVWLVSGQEPNVATPAPIKVSGNLNAPKVATSDGWYAYAVEDLSQKITQKRDRINDLPPAFGDSPQRLRQQSIFVPSLAGLAPAQITPLSYGLLTNPISGGFKVDLDTAPADELATSVLRWRNAQDLIRGRPVVWAEAAVLLGIYKNGGGVPQLGLAFWADVWNPYTLELPFNAKNLPDLRLRLQGPSGTVKYFNAGGALVGFERVDVASHTVDSPVLTDLFGPMAKGEVRFITHRRIMPISSADYPDAVSLQIDFPAGNWDFIFETLDGQPVQKITGIPYDSFTVSAPYRTLAEDDLNSTSAQWVLSWKLKEPLTALLAAVDPRASEVVFNPSFYTHEANPARAQSSFNSFSKGDFYRDGQFSRVFDLPEGSLVSPGSLWSMTLPGAPAKSLGSASAGVANDLLDRTFFSSLPPTADAWGGWNPGAGVTLPNANLRLVGTPSFDELRANPAQYLLTQGAFNINTATPEGWLSLLPAERYDFPFRTDMPTQPAAIAPFERLGWAQALAERVKTRGQPWRSISQLAAENILPADVLCRMSALLQPRGDTFTIYVTAGTGELKCHLQALVQRLPGKDGNSRRFQVLAIRWDDAP